MNHRAILEERVEGTCSWVLHSQRYKSWHHDDSSTILWITGKAGTGKTILISFLIEVLQHEASQHLQYSQPATPVCYFFCAKNVQGKWDACSIVRGSISQVLVQSPTTIIRQVRTAIPLTIQHFDQSYEGLWRLFMYAVGIMPCECLHVVIDALDECDDASQRRFIKTMAKSLVTENDWTTSLRKKLKLIAASHPQLLAS